MRRSKMVDRQYELGLARHTDPQTSHDAARKTNATRGEKIVIDSLEKHGPMTMEEVGNLFGKAADNLGPRFKPLVTKGLIRVQTDLHNKIIKRPGRTGTPRQVYELTELWDAENS